MAKPKQTKVAMFALATATPGILMATTAKATGDAVVPESQLLMQKPSLPDEGGAATVAARALIDELTRMTLSQKLGLAAARVPKIKVLKVAREAVSTAASCSNPCPQTKVLCPHPTTVKAGCPSTVSSSGCGTILKTNPNTPVNPPKVNPPVTTRAPKNR